MQVEHSQPSEIAHVLFMDIVSYSTLPMDEQRRVIRHLQSTVRKSPEFIRAESKNRLMPLPTGDGMALVFFGDPESPVRCALELSRSLLKDTSIKLRMGVHTGPIYRIADINSNTNVSGAGINFAQRVMDCGDAGHILVSDMVANVLRQLGNWDEYLHELGEAEVKHGVRLHLFNLCHQDVGNSNVPKKLLACAPAAVSPKPQKKADKSPLARGGVSEPPVIVPQGRTLSTRIRDSLRRMILIGMLLVMVGLGLWVLSLRTRAISPIAVLPFFNASGDSDWEILSEGIPEDIINSLSQLPDLQVRARSVVFRYKGRDIEPRQVGHELGVRAVVTGRLVTYDNTLRVQVELVDVRKESQLWGAHYDKKMSDIPALQSDISKDISNELRVKLTGEDEKRLKQRNTGSLEAYLLYHKGRYYWNQRTPTSINLAIGCFQQTIEKDPNYALAYVGLADSYVVPANPARPHDRMPKAKAAVMKALQLDDTLAAAHASLGRILMVYDWDWTGAERELKRAIQIDPDYAIGHQWYGAYLGATGHAREAIAERKQARALDSVSLTISNELGIAYYFARDYDRAIDQFRQTLQMDPNFPPANAFLPAALEQNKQYEEAILDFGRAIQRTEGWERSLSIAGLGHTYARAGMKVKAQQLVAELERLSNSQYVSAYHIALIYAGLEDKNQAFTWLNNAIKEHSFDLASINADPRVDPLRSDPRFHDLLHRLDLQH